MVQGCRTRTVGLSGINGRLDEALFLQTGALN